MDAQYRLVFRGEVAEGQHAAVVQKRLAKLLKLTDEKAAQLFTGKTVVLRRSVDAKTAAQFQAAFKQAGAQLRVQPIRESSDAPSADSQNQAPATDAQTAEQPDPAEPATEDGLHLLPVGSFLLEVHERLPPVDAQIAIDHLSLKDNAEVAAQVQTTAEAASSEVNVDHLTIAEPGAQLGADADATAVPVPEFAFEFELAEDGSWLSEDDEQSQAAVLAAPDYSLAEPGARLVEPNASAAEAPEAPDVSHLSLQTNDDDSD